jgi:hypothetical protein
MSRALGLKGVDERAEHLCATGKGEHEKKAKLITGEVLQLYISSCHFFTARLLSFNNVDTSSSIRSINSATMRTI